MPDLQAEFGSVQALHDAYAGPLFVFAVRALGDRTAAEEVVQDTLVRAWQHGDRYDPDRGSVPTWLFTIARNLVIDRTRRRAARPRVVTDLDGVPVADDDAAIDRALEAWQVAEALRLLSPHHRDAIVQVYYQGCSIADAAQRLDVPQGTVKSRLFYGLRALRLHLEEMGVVS